jgi:hypothetical protein
MSKIKDNILKCPYYVCPLRGDGCYTTEADLEVLKTECDMFRFLVELEEKLKSMLPYRFDDENYQLLKHKVGWLKKIFQEIEDRAVDEYLISKNKRRKE